MKKRFKRTHRYIRGRPYKRDVRPVIVVCIAVIIVSVLLQLLVLKSGRLHSVFHSDQTRTATPAVPTDSAAKPYGVALGGTLNNLSKSQLDDELSDLDSIGVQWIRIDVAWPEVQPTNGTQHDWSGIDRIISAAKSYHLKVLGTLAYTPNWAAGSCDNTGQKCAPANDGAFASFATSAVRRYGNNGINAWEIWNEPNNQGFWMPSPNPAAYTQLLKASYAAIKAAEPSAIVLSGSLGPSDNQPESINPVSFLAGMYANGAQGYFDAVGYHPYSYPNLPLTSASWSGWSMMDALPTSIRSVMSANGDANKQIWITEYGAPTGGSGPTESETDYGLTGSNSHVDNQLQAAMLTQSTQQYEADSWLGNYFWYSYKDLGTNPQDTGDFFGLLNYNGTRKPAYTAYEQAIHSTR